MKWISEDKVRRLIKYDGSCCLSCHEDCDEYGYSMIGIRFSKEREAEVCCAVSNAFHEWDKKNQAAYEAGVKSNKGEANGVD
jgi:hypothetical protein